MLNLNPLSEAHGDMNYNVREFVTIQKKTTAIYTGAAAVSCVIQVEKRKKC